MPTTVVNIKKQKCDVYIGRPGPFGNPFRIGEHGDRELVLSRYKAYFYRRLTEPEFRDKILALKGKVLGCWCKPLTCHGDVIVDYLENANNESHISPTTESVKRQSGFV